MYARMYVSTYMCLCTRVFVWIHACMQISMHICVHVRYCVSMDTSWCQDRRLFVGQFLARFPKRNLKLTIVFKFLESQFQSLAAELSPEDKAIGNPQMIWLKSSSRSYSRLQKESNASLVLNNVTSLVQSEIWRAVFKTNFFLKLIYLQQILQISQGLLVMLTFFQGILGRRGFLAGWGFLTCWVGQGVLADVEYF